MLFGHGRKHRWIAGVSILVDVESNDDGADEAAVERGFRIVRLGATELMILQTMITTVWISTTRSGATMV
jgi:hypothetical protein